MNKDILVKKTDLAISELVQNKDNLKKFYNYYNCKRDPEQFKYLEENYGIGQPTSVEFVPLIRKHIDALVGEYLDIPILPKVSCKDEETINNIFREKQVKIATECFNLLQKNLKNNLLRVLGSQDMIDLNIKEQLDKLIEDINENFISQYEIAGQNVVEYIIQSRNIDLITKLKQLFIDLLVTGYNFYRVIPSPAGQNIQVQCLNPLNVFPDLNCDSPYIKDSYRVVVRTYLTRNEILNKYGKELKREDISKIRNEWQKYLLDYSNSVYIRNITDSCGNPATDGVRAGEEVTPGYPEQHWYRYDNNIIPVYEVEWIETDDDFIMQRYSTIRIGDDIYILRGKDENVIRTKDDPTKCTLTVNGVWFNNRNKDPYSMVSACMILQDKYDLTLFYRDKLIANSGSVGEWINMPTLPAFLGDSMPERIMKWLAYKKQGLGIIDTSQEGQLNTGQAPMNQIFNGFDDTLKLQAVQAIQTVADSIEATASSITGVFRERLNGIQQRDAVTNVQIGINNSFTVTKQWHFQMDLTTREILLDCLDCAKIVYKKGLTGVLILGKYQQIFTALPEHFTVTDHDIHLTTSSEIIKEMEQIKTLIPEFIKGGIVSPDILVDIMTAKSLTEMKTKVKQSIRKQKQENNQIQQLTQQVEELQNQLQQAQQQLQQAQGKIESLNEAKLQIEQQKVQLQYQIDDFKAKTDRTFKENQAENDTKRTEIELMQLYDGNPYNDEVKNV